MKNHIFCNRLNVIKFSFLSLLILLTYFVNAQPKHYINTPPKNFQERVDSIYPKSQNPMWFQYDSGGHYMFEAVFDRNGDVVSLEIGKDDGIDSNIQLSVNNVPLKVKQKFNSIFPGVKNVDLWLKGDGGNLNKSNYNDYKAVFSGSPTIPFLGTLTLDSLCNIIQMEYSISIDSLPQKLIKYVRSHYKGYRLFNNTELLIDSKGKRTYLTGVSKEISDNHPNGYWLYFNKTGELIKKTEISFITTKL